MLTGAILAGSPAFAQNDHVPARDPKACAPDAGTQLNSPDTPTRSGATTGTGGNLSDRLARSDGVICPPEVDPDIKAPAPGGGKTPVIPPPGAPGGDPQVQPK
ncbi:MAG: hypothetical protein J0H89_00815 [Rhizobiales bacterium]|nr:hypothetical protein [Hyphomicrobiales bacterium]